MTTRPLKERLRNGEICTGTFLLFLSGGDVVQFFAGVGFVLACFTDIRFGAAGAKWTPSGSKLGLPAYPLDTVQDPTGAGDSFAGGFMGYLTAHGEGAEQDHGVLRSAMTYGSVMASFNVEDFGTERVQRLTRDEIDRRFDDFRTMTSMPALSAE